MAPVRARTQMHTDRHTTQRIWRSTAGSSPASPNTAPHGAQHSTPHCSTTHSANNTTAPSAARACLCRLHRPRHGQRVAVSVARQLRASLLHPASQVGAHHAPHRAHCVGYGVCVFMCVCARGVEVSGRGSRAAAAAGGAAAAGAAPHGPLVHARTRVGGRLCDEAGEVCANGPGVRHRLCQLHLLAHLAGGHVLPRPARGVWGGRVGGW